MPYLVSHLVLTCYLDLIQVLARSKQGQARDRPAPGTVHAAPLALGGGHPGSARRRDRAHALVLVKPETVLRWHREIVRRQWTYGNTTKRGRPATPAAVDLIVRLAWENRAWGYGKIQGELLEVGRRVSRATIRRTLRRQALPPAPRRGQTTCWRASPAQHREQLLACDCFPADTPFLQRRYVLSFIALGSRRLHLAGCTATPDTAWVTRQARQRTWQLPDVGG
jgi:hypothetical protein